MHSSKCAALLVLQIVLMAAAGGCSSAQSPLPAATPPETATEPLARTEFTDRIENFFEYDPLHSGKPSQLRIHLTDLSDGSPVAQAQVALRVRAKGSDETVVQTVARIGKVTGIYVADLTIAHAGVYDIEFHIKNNKLDERLPLSDFKVE